MFPLFTHIRKIRDIWQLWCWPSWWSQEAESDKVNHNHNPTWTGSPPHLEASGLLKLTLFHLTVYFKSWAKHCRASELKISKTQIHSCNPGRLCWPWWTHSWKVSHASSIQIVRMKFPNLPNELSLSSKWTFLIFRMNFPNLAQLS